jgi:hypothetical protein
MDEKKITATVFSSDTIPFAVQDYVTFNNEKYYIFNKPSAVKTARTGENIGDALKYDLEFYSEHRKLKDVLFQDWVTADDSDVYFTGESTFHFYNDVSELAYRIQANLDRFFGEGVWSVNVDPSVILEESMVTIDKQYLWDGLLLANSIYGLDFFISNKNITIGGSGSNVSSEFQYGKDKGLYEINRSYDIREKVITRLKTRGSSRNIPPDYLRDENSKGRYFTSLMLPNFATTDIDYVDAPQALIDEYGIIEGIKIFDDIFPSIEEADIGLGRIDAITSVIGYTEDDASFKVGVRDLGFDVLDYLTSETPRISIKGKNADGSPTRLGGYEFEILNSEKSGSGYTLTLAKAKEGSHYLPDLVTTIRAGDRYVILGIEMPQSYITNAENKLKERAESFFSDGAGIDLTYNIKVDEKFTTLQDLGDEFIAGNKIKITDSDFNVSDYFSIQEVSIEYGKSILPKYNLKISNTKPKTFWDQVGESNIKINDNNVRSNVSIDRVNNRATVKTDAINDKLTWK